MPYVRKGKTVYKKSGKKVGTFKTVKKAKSHLRTLNAIYHGWTPTKRPKPSAWKGGRRKK